MSSVTFPPPSLPPPAPFFPLPEEEDRNESAGSRGIKTDVENAARSRAATGTPSR